MLKKEQKYIGSEILKLVESSFSGEITVEEFDGVRVRFDGENAVIGCSSKVQFARGVFLLAKNYKNGAFEITQKPHFDLLGISIDVSRNGVYTVDTLKKWVVNLAALGFTHISLYLEDVYELEKYPRFGYMRGRYTKEEFIEFNEYAELFGVEIVPTVQSLGHMAQYLQWREAAPIKDTANCLLVDEPKTYEFLETAVAFMRECFPKAKYLNICADEAHDLGSGNYLRRNGYESKTELVKRHAIKMFEIADKYGFSPFMYSDMFYRSVSKTGQYYDKNVHLTPKMSEELPEDMMICYWDYYHTSKEDFTYFINEHKQLKRRLMLLSAVWTWEGFVEDTFFTYKTAVPFVRAALETGEKSFMAAFWGDKGNETNYFHSMGSLAIFSEHCYRGLDCTDEDIFAVSEFLTKMPYENKFSIGKIHSDFHDDNHFSTKHIYGDIFFNLANIRYDYDKTLGDVLEAQQKTAEYMAAKDKNYKYYELCHYVAKLTAEKLELMHTVRPAYESGNREYLRLAAEQKIPQFMMDCRTFIEIFKKDWLAYKKSNGIEVVMLRLAAVIEQASYRREQLMQYLNGEISVIPELEEKLIVDPERTWDFKTFSPSTWKI